MICYCIENNIIELENIEYVIKSSLIIKKDTSGMSRYGDRNQDVVRCTDIGTNPDIGLTSVPISHSMTQVPAGPGPGDGFPASVASS